MTFGLTVKQIEANAILASPARHIMLAGGSRSGKSFLTVRAMVIRALMAPASRHAVFRLRANAVWTSIGLDTFPKVMRLCFPEVSYKPHVQDRYFTLPGGSEIWLGGLDEKDRVEKILGMEFATLFFNEASQIPYSSYLVALTRLAQVVQRSNGTTLPQRCLVDLNPCGTSHWTNRLYVQHMSPDTREPIKNGHNYRFLYMNPGDNRANLSDDYIASLEALPERQRRRFFEGLFIDEIDGALWPYELLDRCRCELNDKPQLERVVVAIDPSGTAGGEDTRADDVGIVVAGKGIDGIVYILADRTCNLPPVGWGRVAVNAYHEFQADRVVAERNFGGAMVEHVIRTTDSRVPYKEVLASRGKAVRAEPISVLYEQGLVRHVGRFAHLEEQMSNFSTAGYLGDRSPDRVDALVWAVHELMLSPRPSAPVFGTYGNTD